MSLSVRNQNIRSVTVLLASNAADKFFGFFRELVVAYIFGSSILYAGYLYLAVFVDAFMAFTGDSALQANLVPRFAKIFSKKPDISLHKTKKLALRFALIFSFLNFILLIFYIFLKGTVPFWLILSFILSLTVGVFIFNSIGMMLLQAKGHFMTYAKGAFLNSSLAAILIYPFSYFFGIIGLALSRLISIASVYFIAWRKIGNKKTIKESPVLTYKDFDLTTLSAANFYVIILLFSKLILSFHTDPVITHFTYATIILGILITSIVKSISSVLLREVSINFNKKMINFSVIAVTILSIGFGIALYYWNIPLIRFIFERGAFNSNDVTETGRILKLLIIPFMLQSITMILIQPVLSTDNQIKKAFKKAVTFMFIIIITGFFIASFTPVGSAFNIAVLMVYILSLLIFIAGFIAFVFTYKNAKIRNIY
jgi:putative peptidoglycan lipid II flippase